MGREVDFRVALLDHCTSVSRGMRNPKIIEFTAYEKTLQETFVDELTGLYNYRYFMQTLRQEVNRAQRG